MSAPGPFAVQAGVMNRLSDGLQARMRGLITGGELESIIAECNDTSAAIERDLRSRWELAAATRRAVQAGCASWV